MPTKRGQEKAGTADTNEQRDIPYYGVMLSISMRGRRKGGDTFRVMMFVFPSHHNRGWSPAFPKMAEHLAAEHNGKW